jgi:branched-chain amino acid transport system substrate-binding protein
MSSLPAAPDRFVSLPSWRPYPGTVHRANPRAVAVALMVSVLVGACTNGGDDTAASTTTVATTVDAPARPGDGVLRIGVLLPRTGAGAQLGRPMIDAVDLARQRINEAGGVNGRDIVVVEVDEGDTVTSAAGGFDTLLRSDVDAIVGPASSLAALATLDAPVQEGVVTCSPTATALALDEYPDDGLFFRTVPSDSLQAVAIAYQAELTGTGSVAIGHLDDPYGRGLAEALTTAVAEQDIELVGTVAFASDDEQLDDEAERLLAEDPGVVVVLGDADDGSRLVAALADAVDIGDPPRIIVNDALRDPASQPVMRDLLPLLRVRVLGVAPLATSTEATLLGPYAASAFDCVNLIALAALQAGSDASAEIATQMASVSVSGSPCRTFDVCKQRLEEDPPLEIDYNGPSGNTTLSNRTGDPVTGQFETFSFAGDGQDQHEMQFDVSSD